MEKIIYNFVKDQNGSLSFQSKVNSFNLDHVVNKDIVSFYTSFSDYSYFDTGLLPIDGTGLLGIRTAGGHTQVIYQYKPGLYHINWGAAENDEFYKNYYLAQPYRIVIIDFLNNNLLGARTFYSVEPAYHSGINLYHVNLPNINCKGYRGNGVGWICLYHNQDWTQLPFNERLSKALERCSGVEVYNDANMSETDGPRFYQQNKMPDYTYDPSIWQEKSSQEGFDWTLDPSNWIPVLVKSRDQQDAHYKNGIQLTLFDAITGNYQAYYYDNLLPKPINAITRSDLSINSKQVTDWFVKAYNNSTTNFQGIDPYTLTSTVREQNSSKIELPFVEKEEEMTICPITEEEVYQNECVKNFTCHIDGGTLNICHNCVENHDNLVFAQNTMDYYDIEGYSDILIHDDYQDVWYDTSAFQTDYSTCPSCSSVHISPWKDVSVFLIWHQKNHKIQPSHCCANCVNQISNAHEQPVASCSDCGLDIPAPGSIWFVPEKIKIVNEATNDVVCQICYQTRQNETNDSPEKKAIKKLIETTENTFNIASLMQKLSEEVLLDEEEEVLLDEEPF